MNKSRKNLIKERMTGIDKAKIADKAIVAVFMSESGDISESSLRLIERNSELSRLRDQANEEEPGICLYRSPRFSDKRYFFIICGDIAETYRAVNTMVEKIKNMNLSGYRIYMEKVEPDPYEIIKTMVEKTGLPIEYFVGGDGDVQPEDKMNFPIDFKPMDFYRYVTKRVIGQDEEVKKIVYYVMHVVEAAAYGRDDPAINCFLTAPSGLGKTEIARAVRDFLLEHEIPVPVAIIDISQITETGFKGKNSNTIIEDICNCTTESCDGRAICFLDEADKKCIPSYSSGGIDVNKAIQANLLTLVEGNIYSLDGNEGLYDSSKTMFVFMGAFQNVRNRKLERHKNLDVEGKFADADEVYFEDLTLSDMINFGMRDELAGRVGRIINLHRLPEDSMRKIILKKSEEVAQRCGIRIELTENALDEFMDIAYQRTGIREVINRIDELAIDSIVDMYFAGRSLGRKKLIINGIEEAVVK